MAKKFKSEDDCSHSNAHKEFISGQRTGEYVCESCGSTWQSSESLDAAQENYRQRQEEAKEGDPEFKRISQLDPASLADQIEQMARDQIGDLVNEDTFSGLIGNTNATGWGIDTLEVEQSSIEISKEDIVCTANVQFTGDQDEDAVPAGTLIAGTVTIRILADLAILIEDEDFKIGESVGDDW